MSDHRLVLPAREGQSPLAQLEIYHCTQEISKESLGRNDQGQGSNNHNLYCSDGMQIRICGLMSVKIILKNMHKSKTSQLCLLILI